MASLVLVLGLCLVGIAYAQTDTLGLADGYLNFTTANFNIKLVKDAQVLASLQPSGSTFDFSPFDYLSQRAANGNHHLGDVTFRYRNTGQSAWTSVDSSTTRAHVTALSNFGVLAASDLAPTLNSSNLSLGLQRQWYNLNGDLALLFNITNKGTTSIEIGGLGFPIEFNNIFTNRAAQATEQTCSLQDPSVILNSITELRQL